MQNHSPHWNVTTLINICINKAQSQWITMNENTGHTLGFSPRPQTSSENRVQIMIFHAPIRQDRYEAEDMCMNSWQMTRLWLSYLRLAHAYQINEVQSMLAETAPSYDAQGLGQTPSNKCKEKQRMSHSWAGVCRRITKVSQTSSTPFQAFFGDGFV